MSNNTMILNVRTSIRNAMKCKIATLDQPTKLSKKDATTMLKALLLPYLRYKRQYLGFVANSNTLKILMIL